MSALDPSRRYLLYCDRGVMSELQAQSLAQAGLRNVGVYRPDLNKIRPNPIFNCPFASAGRVTRAGGVKCDAKLHY